MQGKGIVKFFLGLMVVLTLLQYFFLVPTNRVEKNAKAFAEASTQDISDEIERKSKFKALNARYLDSMSNEVIFSVPLINDFTYQELKSRQLALGLDLKGGMSIVLQVDLRELIRKLASDTSDPTFAAAMKKAEEAQSSAQSNFVSLFIDAWKELDQSNGDRLAQIFSKNETMREEIDLNSSVGDVERALRGKADETVKQTFDLLKKRIDKLGVAQPNVTLDENRDMILVELPGIDNPERAREFLKATANLEFWKVYRVNDPGIRQGFIDYNNFLATTQGVERQFTTTPVYGENEDGSVDSTNIVRYDTTYQAMDAAAGPLLSKLRLANGEYGLSVFGAAKANEMPLIQAMLDKPEIRDFFPDDASFHWARDMRIDYDEEGNKLEGLTNEYELYVIRTENGEAPLTGERVVKASGELDPQKNEVYVSLNMDNAGAKTWRRLTTEAANDNNREIAILLDGEVVSAPRVINPIPGGNSSITGNYTIQEAEDLASILQIGRLPAETRIIQEDLVGPTLGAENIRRSITAMVIGFVVLLLFMLAYYGGGGIVSIVALLLNMIFIFAALASYGTVLTLPGIAGIILTIGMAVDANVIIYERIREELREGKSLRMAINDGFQNSYSAIIDANVTTILTALVLAYFGLGPIKGFAVVLIIGVLCSLFTAVLLGRLMIDWWTGKDGRTISFSTGFSKGAFANLNIDWLSKRKIAYGISLAIIALGLVSMFTKGFDLGVDFRGGYSYNVSFDRNEDVTVDALRASLENVFPDASLVIKEVDTDNTFNIVTSYLVDDQSEGAADQVMAALHKGVNEVTKADLKLTDFKDADGTGTYVNSSSKVGPTIADDIRSSSFKAAIFALLLIFLYIFIRFSKWQYSLGAIAALAHDSLIVLSLFSILHGILPFSMEIDQAFIAAILTVIGYSINDTVVVFDRIREYFNQYTQKSKNEVINMAINSTVSRTVITSLTTLFVVGVLFTFGGGSIRGFAFALIIGIVVGTYSSIFVATPIMADLTDDMKSDGKKGDEKKRFSKALSK